MYFCCFFEGYIKVRRYICNFFLFVISKKEKEKIVRGMWKKMLVDWRGNVYVEKKKKIIMTFFFFFLRNTTINRQSFSGSLLAPCPILRINVTLQIVF